MCVCVIFFFFGVCVCNIHNVQIWTTELDFIQATAETNNADTTSLTLNQLQENWQGHT